MLNQNEIELPEKDKKEEDSFQQRKPVSIIDFGNLDDLANISIENKFNNIPHNDSMGYDYLEQTSKSVLKTIAYYLNTANPIEWIFIVFFSMVLTFICFILDLIIEWGLDLRLTSCTTGSPFANLIIWVTSAISLLLVATSVGYFISADADGSGIPEVKTVLSGINIYRYFSVEAFVAKAIGLCAALLGGNFFIIKFFLICLNTITIFRCFYWKSGSICTYRCNRMQSPYENETIPSS
jgi:hypothetical protein